MKTIKQFVEATHIEASLVRAVIRQVGGWDSFKDLAADVANHGANAGFSGFTYYSDTVPFAKRNKEALIGECKRMADDIGDGSAHQLIAGFNCIDLQADEVAEAIHNPRSENRTEVFNALAWFALEEVSRSYCDLTEE